MPKTSLEIAIRLIFHDFLTHGRERVKEDWGGRTPLPQSPRRCPTLARAIPTSYFVGGRLVQVFERIEAVPLHTVPREQFPQGRFIDPGVGLCKV